MKTRKITESQLREMIKESLEESVVEIQLDEQIETLKARGSRRTLAETKRYHKLLEAKLQMMNEGLLATLGGKIKSALGFGGKEKEEKKEEDIKIVADFKKSLASGAVKTVIAKLLKTNKMARAEAVAAFAKELSIDDPSEFSSLFTSLKKDAAEAREAGKAESATKTAMGGLDRTK